MALSTRTRIAGILAVCLLTLGAPGALAGSLTATPDAEIRLGSGSYVGGGITNDDAIGQEVTGSGAVAQKLTFWIKIRNAGDNPSTFTVKRSGFFDEGYRVRYYDAASNDITGKVNKGTFSTPSLGKNALYEISATVKVRSQATACSSVTRLINVQRPGISSYNDAVRFTAKLNANCPPLAVDDGNSVTEDNAPNPIAGNVLSNDSDPDGDTLSVGDPDTYNLQYGTLVVAADGGYTYTLNNANTTVDGLSSGQTLQDSHTYELSDGHGGTDTATLTITIHGHTDGPTCVRNTGVC